MEFPNAKVKSIRANIGSSEITMSFSLTLDDDSLAVAEELAVYLDPDLGRVDLRVIPQQAPLVSMITHKITEPAISEVKMESL